MKHFLVVLFLLAAAAPLFAFDDGGDGVTIPDYRELVREGYGPRESAREGYLLLEGYGLVPQPKPTQAYYGKGYTIYYGYTTVLMPSVQANAAYAFGYPLEYFRNKLPASVDDVQLSHYALEIRDNHYGPGDFVAQAQKHRTNAVTTVQSVTPATPASASSTLLPVAEKTSH